LASVHAFDVLGDPVRRRILELLAAGEQTSGGLSGVIREEFGISQPAVSQHLRVLRESGFATVRAEGTRRLYAVGAAPLREVDAWLDRFRSFWEQRPHALGTEPVRGRRERRAPGGSVAGAARGGPAPVAAPSSGTVPLPRPGSPGTPHRSSDE
jgi:DNA-binding transcriptional ArsR family regulator